MLSLFLQAALAIWIMVTLLWLISIRLKDVSIVDLFWGLGFVVVNGIYFVLSDGPDLRQALVTILVTVWGLRLAIYLSWRNRGKGEDYRYRQFRKDFGPERYWWFSYFQVFLLQGGFILLVSLPLLAVYTGTGPGELNWIDYLGIVIWLIGFVFEAGGDYQLARFKADPANKGKVLDSGFWKYTRHPNYFGDAAVWWAYALFSIAAGGYWQIIGSLIMTALIIKVSGVALLEKSLKDSKPQYREYIRKTSAFIPWFPKS
ncbi:MAG: DUF1295 domain-containing protein [Bacteroidia bacterium]